MHIGIISKFPPSLSGIAEFSEDFQNALLHVDPSIQCSRIVIDDGKSKINTDTSVLCTIKKENEQDYIDATQIINESSINILIIQHEFFSYGGPQGIYLSKLVQKVKKPIVFFPHTVPVDIDAHFVKEQQEFFQSIQLFVKTMVVFLPQAKQTLLKYGYKQQDIFICPHAVPLIQHPSSISMLRKKIQLPTDRWIVMSFGFFHPDKGTTVTLEAIKQTVQKYPDILFFYAGTTLPMQESQGYFKYIRQLIHKEHIEQYVYIDMNFIQKQKLFSYIQACDVGIVPYIYRSYTASGPLSFFIGAGKPIIATPFAYASSILTPKNSCIVPFENANAVAQGIEKIKTDEKYRTMLEKNCQSLRSSMTWDVIGKNYCQMLHVINKEYNPS